MKKFNLFIVLILCWLPDVALGQLNLGRVLQLTDELHLSILDNLLNLTISGHQTGCNEVTTCSRTCGNNEACMSYNSCWESCNGTLETCSILPTSFGCYCRPNYMRINGRCQLLSNCPCGQNEIYGIAVSECQEFCNNTQNCPSATYYRCGCLPGFKRINGICVEQRNCDTFCGVNEVYAVTNPCFDICGNSPFDCTLENKYGMCVCTRGHQRASNGTCLPYADACSCPANETYRSSTNCIEQCDMTNCAEPYSFPQCLCNTGLVRINGRCVPSSNCPASCSGQFEELTYGNECMDRCGQNSTTCYNSGNGGNSRRQCMCLQQFKRINGICVPDTQCQCPPNEHMANLNDCFEQCGSNPIVCDENWPMWRGCFCNLNYVRVNGACVPDTVCSQGCGEHEVYRYSNECFESCNNTGIDCSNQPSYRRCTCEPGYKRIDGVCCPEIECPCGVDEEYGHGNYCLEKCGANEDSCRGHEYYKGCFCREGCARINGVCKSRNHCPENRVDPEK